MADVTAPAENRDSLNGFLFALSAYLLWGFLPLYMKALAHISPAEVIAHRILWSVPVAGLLLIILKRTDELKKAMRNPRMLGMAAVTATLISVNWGIYVWAIGAGHALDTALGYFINPLFSILLGAVLLKEKLKRTQIAALALVVVAVVILTVEAGRLPVVALALTFSWGFYAFFRKTLPIGPNQGFLLEVLLLTPFAFAYLVYLNLQGGGHFLMGNTTDTILLASAGLVTAVPLILYANGAKLLRLSTIGIMQYIAPSMIFITAVFVFHEPFSTAKAIAFPLIWAALVIYTLPMLRQR
ncbi:EamA family transporter RarD [Rhizobium rosettiformans]|jgi:chloramphenicol-sensitive protein RarD|uniref:EamA family transporter RarD n=2 Tax=Rhizobium rosettiformans TaxID=1368430 RepID=A0A4S8Q673_9HYPH|nr:EamA family transporter RarD [Rhizobium rosettiformans]MBB5274108.1 chloramphenicol-sensitive protein RarD [Rhizobium rosettiformans]MDR7026976.1 chloramphenicol-sensitive protein RarD [Rhizobium rosettiformans]MDR7065097.1 chloramphenicol-sensitive protein RarD [Rhizobium rosettiformans]THV38232.1 EamA family transporter RarD [Rhizobium rosettiformans W3]